MHNEILIAIEEVLHEKFIAATIDRDQFVRPVLICRIHGFNRYVIVSNDGWIIVSSKGREIVIHASDPNSLDFVIRELTADEATVLDRSPANGF